MLPHYLKLAWRNIVRYKMQSIISITGMAIGFTAFILAGYWYYWENTFDTFHPDWERTYAITTSNYSEEIDNLNQLNKYAREEFEKFSEVEKVTLTNLFLHSPEKQNRVWVGMEVEESFFDMFHHEFIEGTYKGNPFDGKSVILTEQMAINLFGSTSCLGKKFEINNKISFDIAGVIKEYPQNTHFKFEYLCLTKIEYHHLGRLPTYIKVKPNTDINQLRNKIEGYTVKEKDDVYNKYSKYKYRLCKLPDVHLTTNSHLKSRFRNIKILFCGGLLAFISALMNLLVLFLSRQQVKLRYNGLYRVIGASTKGLILRGITELTVFMLISFIVSMTLIEIIFPFYQEYTTIHSEGEIFSNFKNFLSKGDLIQASVISFAISGILFLLLCIIPIYFLIQKHKKSTSFALRDFLVSGQIFIGSLFLITALAFYLQYSYTRNTDKGIVPDNIWQIDVGFFNSISSNYSGFLESIKQSSYIEEVTTTTNEIFSTSGIYYGSYQTILNLNKNGEVFKMNVLLVEPNFLPFFGLQMKSGEWLSESDHNKYVMNEIGAKEIGIKNNLSKEGTPFSDIPIEFKGIVKNFYYTSMQNPLKNVFIKVREKESEEEKSFGQSYIYIKVKPENKDKVLAFLKEQYGKFSNEEVPLEKRFLYLPEVMENLNASDIKMSWIFLTLAATSILISALGIYSLVSLSVEQRKKEIAIRKISGATFADILKLFLKRYLFISIISNLIALPIGYLFISKWLETYAYHFELSIWLFAIVLIIINVIIILSVSKQVNEAMKINESSVLKLD